MKYKIFLRSRVIGCSFLMGCLLYQMPVSARDLTEIQEEGMLRHLGIPYANFVTGSGDGLDVELIERFAAHLGVQYEYVETNWQNVFGDLTGRHARSNGDDAEFLEKTPIRGDLIANGLTVLPWRQKIVDYSVPTFPSGVWLIARTDSSLQPIRPSGSLVKDIAAVKALLPNRSVLGLKSTCLDPDLYRMEETGADMRLLDTINNLNEMVPAILNGDGESTLLDVPDALIALEKWPGQIKVIGPISPPQDMGIGFRKSSPKLRAAFNDFLHKIKEDGTYVRLVKKYYPAVFRYYRDHPSLH